MILEEIVGEMKHRWIFFRRRRVAKGACKEHFHQVAQFKCRMKSSRLVSSLSY